MYDDTGQFGGLNSQDPFVILCNLNSDPVPGVGVLLIPGLAGLIRLQSRRV